MKQEHLTKFGAIAQPPKEYSSFRDELQKPVENIFKESCGCPPGSTANCMADGVDLLIRYPETPDFPQTAIASLRCLLKQKNIRESKGAYPVVISQDPSLTHEEYKISIQPDQTQIIAADSDGLRRAVYFFEDRISEAEGPAATQGEWQRKPFIRNRISRCFFGPTNRPPFYIDELTDDLDYYPEEYLNRLAHEGVNGLWLTMYFRDLPSSIFPGRGKFTEKRFAKLRHVVQKCAAYGIRIFIFLSEPKRFGENFFTIPVSDAENHREVIGIRTGKQGTFCTSSETGKKYIVESVSQIFKAVPELGGIINIMYGEDNGSCAGDLVNEAASECTCPVCRKRDFADIYREQAGLFTQTMHRFNQNAEYIGWFYAPCQRDDTSKMKNLLHIAEKWPEDASLMFNFESGGTLVQLGKQRVVYDYSLAYVGPSKLFAKSADIVPKAAAKIQVGCSHEDASVPYIPVPQNLYEKYRFMHAHHVSSVMQCWYFGNYPGLMNKCAGELSFLPFPRDCRSFIADTIRPQWRKDTERVTEALMKFSEAYRMFPANLLFEWYGPLHNCIVWPLFLFPEDKPIAPSWLLNQFPSYSGDRIGECIAFHHTLAEALELCRNMSEKWQEGFRLLNGLKASYINNKTCRMDIQLAEAIGLQMKSAYNLLNFYFLREDMLYCRKDHLAEMKVIVEDEIRNSARMSALCEEDSRLGYHSEAEGYLFYPEKLLARIDLLKELLENDFPKYRINDPRWDVYTGLKPEGDSAVIYRKGTKTPNIYAMGHDASWQAEYDDEYIYFCLYNIRDKHAVMDIEPCRHWISACVFLDPPDRMAYSSCNYAQIPEKKVEYHGNDILLSIPLHMFDGFRREGFPMRINIWGEDFHWVDPKPWPWRLQHNGYNPAGMGWLIMM